MQYMISKSDMIYMAGDLKIKVVEYDSRIEKIGVISDTHIPTRGRYLPPRLFEIFNGVQLILHAGDLVEEAVIDELRVLAPVEAVAGNMDPVQLHNRLGNLKLIKVGEIKIGLLHGDSCSHKVNFKQMKKLFKPVELNALVFGHLHEPLIKNEDSILFINPGSAVDPRREPRASCGFLSIDGSQISGEIFYL